MRVHACATSKQRRMSDNAMLGKGRAVRCRAVKIRGGVRVVIKDIGHLMYRGQSRVQTVQVLRLTAYWRQWSHL